VTTPDAESEKASAASGVPAPASVPIAAPSSSDPAPPVPVPSVPEPAVAPPAMSVAPVGASALPEQSSEDTDAAWGEYAESAEERLYRDRPPHWDDF
jgi:hypothetical protein